MKSLSARTRRIGLRIIFATVVVAAGFLLARAITRYGLAEITAAWSEIGFAHFAAAAAFAAGSYATLTFFDFFGLHYAGHPLRYRRAAAASFVSLSIGHNLGVAALSSGAVRYRFYSRWGLTAEQIAKVIAFSGVTVAVGLATLGGLATVLMPSVASNLAGLGPGATFVFAAVCLSVPMVYCGAAAIVRRSIHIHSWSFALPSLKIACAQVLVGTLNFSLVAACLHQLMLGIGDLPYLKVAAVYVVANASGIISHVPGGLGVLETTAGYLFQDTAALPALIAFRVVYFLMPLAFGLTAFAIIETTWRWRGGSRGQAASNPSERARSMIGVE